MFALKGTFTMEKYLPPVYWFFPIPRLIALRGASAQSALKIDYVIHSWNPVTALGQNVLDNNES